MKVDEPSAVTRSFERQANSPVACGWLLRRHELLGVVLVTLRMVPELVGHVYEFIGFVM